MREDGAYHKKNHRKRDRKVFAGRKNEGAESKLKIQNWVEKSSEREKKSTKGSLGNRKGRGTKLTSSEASVIDRGPGRTEKEKKKRSKFSIF